MRSAALAMLLIIQLRKFASGKLVSLMRMPSGGDTGLITMLNACVSLPGTFVALTVKLNVPAAVGVPEMVPSLESARPAGRLPPSTFQEMGASPSAVRVWLYAVPTVPPGRDVVVMAGDVAGAEMIISSRQNSIPL